MPQMEKSATEDKYTNTPKVSTWSKLRRNPKARMGVIIFLMAVVVFLFFFYGKFKAFLIGIFIFLLVALGLEVSGNDWDLGKLWETKSFEQSKVQQTEKGTWLIGERCSKDNLNCDNFKYQEEAQDLFDECGGTTNDVHGLDRDKDGMVCEDLPTSNSVK